MKRFAMLVTGLALAACSESTDLTSARQFDIQVPGNQNLCPTPGDGSCFPPLDSKLKKLYDQNNAYSRVGEAQYELASATNLYLAQVFYDPRITQAAALRYVDRFITDVTAGVADGRYSQCAGSNVLNYARWIRAKIATINFDFSTEPGWPRCVTGLANGTAIGMFNGTGVTVSFPDRWHFSNGPYGDEAVTYFVFQRQNADASWTTLAQTSAAVEPNAVLKANTPTTVFRTWVDLTAKGTAGASVTYAYRALQCEAGGDTYPAPNNYCARDASGGYAWATASITLTDPAIGPPPAQCVNHDNSNKDPAPNNNRNKDKCEKTPPGQAKKT